MRKLSVFLTATAVTLLSACSTTPQGQRIERIAIQGTVLHIIEQAARPADKAQRIANAVKLARTLLTDETVTVGVLRSALLKRVAEREDALPLSEKLVLLEAINTISDEVEKRVGSGILAKDALLTVNTVLGWVGDAAAFYVPVERDT